MLHRMHPAQMLILAALVMAGASYFVCEGAPLFAWVIVILVCVPLIRTRRHEQTLMLALIASLSAGYAYMRLPKPSPNDLSQFAATGEVRFSGKIVSFHQGESDQPDQSEVRARLVVAPKRLLYPYRMNLDGRVSIVASVATADVEQLRKRPAVEIFSNIYLPQKAMYPWEFDLSKYLSRQHIFCQAKVPAKQMKLVEGNLSAQNFDLVESLLDSGQNSIDWLRGVMLAAHRNNLGAQKGDLLSSMVLGEAAVGLDEKVQQLFRETGLSHLLAASGFNLTIVVGSVYFLANALSKNSSLIGLVSMTSILGFVMLAGPSPSVVRAAITCTFVIVARCCYRRLHMGSALASALILANVLDPDCVTDIGLQLSYAATAAILMGAKHLSKRLQEILRWKVLVPLCDLLAVILLAQAAVLPLQSAYFWQVGWLFLPANLIVDPLIAPITCLGFLSSLVAVISQAVPGCDVICSTLDRIAGVMLGAIMIFLKFITSFGEAQLRGAPYLVSVVFYWFSVIALLFALRTSKYLRCALLCYAVALTYLLLPPILPVLTLAASNRQVALVDSGRQFVTIWQSGDDRNMSRFLLYHGMSACSKLSSSFKSEEGKCGVSLVCSKRCGATVYVLSRSPCEIDVDEVAAFVDSIRKRNSYFLELQNQSNHRSLIVYRQSNERSHVFEEICISRLAHKIAPDAAILCVQTAGARSNLSDSRWQPLKAPGSISRLRVSHSHVARAVLIP